MMSTLCHCIILYIIILQHIFMGNSEKYYKFTVSFHVYIQKSEVVNNIIYLHRAKCKKMKVHNTNLTYGILHSFFSFIYIGIILYDFRAHAILSILANIIWLPRKVYTKLWNSWSNNTIYGYGSIPIHW